LQVGLSPDRDVVRRPLVIELANASASSFK